MPFRSLDPLDYGLPTLASRLSRADAEALAAAANRVRRHDGQSMFARGDSAQFCVVVEGAVRLTRTSTDGKRVSMGLWGPGHHFGLSPPSPLMRSYDATAVGDAEVDALAPEDLDRILDQRPSLARALLWVTSRRLALLTELFDDARLASPAVRVGRLLAYSLRPGSEDGRIRCLQEDIAQVVGVSSVTAAQALRDLGVLGLVETGYRHVRLPDPEALRAWLAMQDA